MPWCERQGLALLGSSVVGTPGYTPALPHTRACCLLLYSQTKDYDPLEHHRSVSGLRSCAQHRQQRQHCCSMITVQNFSAVHDTQEIDIQ